MRYDKASFLNGILVGQQLKGWSFAPVGHLGQERVVVNGFYKHTKQTIAVGQLFAPEDQYTAFVNVSMINENQPREVSLGNVTTHERPAVIISSPDMEGYTLKRISVSGLTAPRDIAPTVIGGSVEK